MMMWDLNSSVLHGWPFTPGKISTRKFIGVTGQEYYQIRVELGVLQLNAEGRPDGKRPYGYESLLEHQQVQLAKHMRRHGDDKRFLLSIDEVHQLNSEAHQYYQRFLAAFVLEEYDVVEHDTQRNLRCLDFISQYAGEEVVFHDIDDRRAYILLMHFRARAHSALLRQNYEEALTIVLEGIEKISALPGCHDELLEVLGELRVQTKMSAPEDSMVGLHRQLDAAVLLEDFETAAALREKIRRNNPLSEGYG